MQQPFHHAIVGVMGPGKTAHAQRLFQTLAADRTWIADTPEAAIAHAQRVFSYADPSVIKQRIASSIPRALLRVSWYSVSGTESATRPAPACTRT